MQNYLRIIVAACMILCAGCSEGITPLMRAARSGDFSQLDVLISEGAKINKKSRYDWTALMFASRAGHKNTVRQLLDAGADPNNVSDKVPSGFLATNGGIPPTTALAQAIREKHFDIVYLLISKGAKLDRSSVDMAAGIGNTQLLAYMKDKGVDFNEYSNDQFYPSVLCSSAASGDLQTVRWLCDNGAKINIILGNCLPLKIAVRNQNADIVSHLLERGANPNMSIGDPTYHHSYPLGEAVMEITSDEITSDNVLKIIRLLLEHGADTSIIDNEGKTVLDQKLIQIMNGKKRRKYLASDPDPVMLEKYRMGDQHDNAVIQMLNKFNRKTTWRFEDWLPTDCFPLKEKNYKIRD